MKKTLKNQILELLNSLNEGITYIEQSKNATNELKLQVLQDCQACILPIKNSIIGNDRAKKSLALMDGIETNLKKMQILLQKNKPLVMISFMSRKQILKIKEIVMQLDNRKEVVFLPYNASMWDSLESIWQAADEDENCDAYVVPVPYCDRNPDGSAKNWNYEGHDLPSYVPITNWQEYDISKHRPDIIYIHNPYDDYNLVTSVHPNYYSKELKKYTDMLVYVPYFVSGDIVGPIKCKAPGVVNADRVIVESEKIKEQYEANYPGGNPPKNKILALGSPKFDKVRNSKKEDFALPKQWEKIINGKKIILYLTTIETMLLDTESFIKKHRYVFSVFRDRKDVALWWRPHPLLKATFESMKPELLKEYEQLEYEYKKAGWGIYDDSSDLYRAITWSDAYYGDMSSVIWLYEVTSKPIMVQNVNIRKPIEECLVDEIIIKRNFNFRDMVVVGDSGWFVGYTNGNLVEIDLNTGEVKSIVKIPCEDLSYRIEKCLNKLYIMPNGNYQYLLEYDYIKYKFRRISLRFICKDTKNKYNKKYKYLIIKEYREKIFLFPYGCEAIIEYDVKKDQCIYHYEWYNKIEKYLINKDKGILDEVYCMSKDSIWISLPQCNAIMEFSFIDGRSNIYEVGDSSSSYSYMDYDGENLWLLNNKETEIIKWNKINLILCRYNIKNSYNVENKLRKFSMIHIFNNNLYIFKAFAKNSLKLDMTTGEITRIKKFDESLNLNHNFIYCDGLHDNYPGIGIIKKRNNQEIVFFHFASNQGYVYNLHYQTIHKIGRYFEANLYSRIMNKEYIKNNKKNIIWKEEELIYGVLENYIQYLVLKQTNAEELNLVGDDVHSVGCKIYHLIG